MPTLTATRRVPLMTAAAATFVGSFSGRAYAKAKGASETWTRFLPQETDSILVPVVISNTPLTAMADTGSTITVVNASMAQRLGLEPAGDGAARGVSHALRLPTGGNLEIRCAGATVRLSRVLIADLSDAIGPDGVPDLAWRAARRPTFATDSQWAQTC